MINGKKYIGVTREPKRRFRKHAEGKSAAVAFNRAVLKYGIDNFSFKILAYFDNVEAANYHENAAIKAFKSLSPDGYNLIGGAPKSKYFGPLSQETKDKIGVANKNKTISREHIEMMNKAREGKPNHAKGKSFTEEHRRRLSEARRGVPLSPEHRDNMVSGIRKYWAKVKEDPKVDLSKRMKDRWEKMTPEQRKRHSEGVSAAHIGTHLSLETRSKLSEIAKKQWEDPEFRKLYSSLRKGKSRKPTSPETKQRISEGRRRGIAVRTANGGEACQI